jgi:nucleotide-binding universal stress UspA family protein
MKILIAYDGSNCAEAALDDLVRAGLPETGEFLVMSVAEVWLPSENLRQEWEAENPDSDYLDEINRKHDKKSKETIAEFETLANHAAARLRRMFPGWTVSAEAASGSPAWEVLTKAEDFKPDLIVAGSQGRSALGRFFLGSISQRVLTEAHCSVRVARGRVEVDPTPVRIVIGFDGSKGAQAAVEAIAQRQWREGCEFRLVMATNQAAPSSFDRFVPPTAVKWLEDEMKSEIEWMEKLAAPALQILKNANCAATLQTVAGNPKKILVEEATRWHADAIFVGSNRFGSRIERFLLGSVSAAVAARAHCSVEVVRK